MTGGQSAGESTPNTDCARNRDGIAQTTFGGGLSHVWPYFFFKRRKQQSALGHTEGPPPQLMSSMEAAGRLCSHEKQRLIKVWHKTSFILFWLLHAIPWVVLYFNETDCTQTHFGISKKSSWSHFIILIMWLVVTCITYCYILSVQESNGRQKLWGIWSLQAD